MASFIIITKAQNSENELACFDIPKNFVFYYHDSIRDENILNWNFWNKLLDFEEQREKYSQKYPGQQLIDTFICGVQKFENQNDWNLFAPNSEFYKFIIEICKQINPDLNK